MKETFAAVAYGTGFWIGAVGIGFVAGLGSSGNFGPIGTAIVVGILAMRGVMIAAALFWAGAKLAEALGKGGDVSPIRSGLFGLLTPLGMIGIQALVLPDGIEGDPGSFFLVVIAGTGFLLGFLERAALFRRRASLPA